VEQKVVVETEPKDGYSTYAAFTLEKFIQDTVEHLEEKPFRNEHSARIREPKDFDSFRRKNDAFGLGISVIYGIKGGKAEVQSIRFSADKFTVAEAHAWLTAHKYHPLEFAAATGKEETPNPEAVPDQPETTEPAPKDDLNPEGEAPKAVAAPVIKIIKPAQVAKDFKQMVEAAVAKEIERIRREKARRTGRAII
jgi:hypothetical protein